jgi:kumamolisin
MTRVVIQHSYNELPANAVSAVPAPLDEIITVLIILRRSTYEGMTIIEYSQKIAEGTITKFLSREELDQMFGAEDSDMDLVLQFLQSNGITVLSSSTMTASVQCSGTIAQFNQAFDTVINEVDTNERVHISYEGELTVPEELDGIILTVLDLDTSGQLNSVYSFGDQGGMYAVDPANVHGLPTLSNGVVPATITGLTPQQVATAYRFPGTSNGNGQCICIPEFGGGYTANDLIANGVTNTVVDVSVNGGINNTDFADSANLNNSVEVMLDIYCAGLAAPKAKLAVYFAGNSFANFVNVLNTAAADTTNCPSAISFSWVSTEQGFNFAGFYTSVAVAIATCTLLGITVFCASGDWGNRGAPGASIGTVCYPAADINCVSCGGTLLELNSNNSILSEVVWGGSSNSGSTGGGVSAYVPTPSYQTGFSYKAYPSGTVTSLPRRGVPDIGGNADGNSGYTFYLGNAAYYVSSVGGTSATAPIMAAMMVRINQLKQSFSGYPMTSWYGNAATCFNDITSGDNTNTTTSTGFQATSGWDACTGLGSPKADVLYGLTKRGITFPKANFGFRRTGTLAYPRVQRPTN